MIKPLTNSEKILFFNKQYNMNLFNPLAVGGDLPVSG
jgi:hypothetical protein